MKLLISCVVDNHPKFLMQVWNLACSLMATGDWPKPGVEFIIHHTRAVDARRLETFVRLGAKLRSVEPWGASNGGYCNKLRQLDSPEVQEADVVLLLDTDVVVVRPLGELATSQTVRGKIVDLPNPPQDVWPLLLKGTMFEGEDILHGSPSMRPAERTPATNFNGGVYVLPSTAIPALKALWPKWSDFCLRHGKGLANVAHHADQIGFALAMMEARIPFEPLSLAENFPLHFKAPAYKDVPPCELAIIHYHSHLNNHGLPMPVGVSWIDAQVRSVSQRIAAARRNAFDNAIFWDFRYDAFPELGSGIGSRGSVLAYKRSRLAPYFRLFADKPVLDVGCGDLETTRHADFRDYTGLDLSQQALVKAAEKRPDWRFSDAPVAEAADGSAALVICLDVLIHQPGAEEAQSLVNHLVRVASDAVIVSGHRAAIDANGIVFAHPPVMDLLRANPEVASVVEIGQYRESSLVFAQKRASVSANSADIDMAGLAWGLANCPSRQILEDLVRLSRDRLGFFPRKITRTLEYPWIASRMQDCSGQRILALGAGVSALPLWLAGRGAEVVTLDHQAIIRDPANRLSWNEGGFLDFALLDQRIVSFNMDLQDFSDAQGFDVIYSASAVAQIPGISRRDVIGRLSRLLRPEGRLLLTLGLVPGSNQLWSPVGGKEVDPPETHGDLQTVLSELSASGLGAFEQSILRGIPDSAPDLVMLDLRPSTGGPAFGSP